MLRFWPTDSAPATNFENLMQAIKLGGQDWYILCLLRSNTTDDSLLTNRDADGKTPLIVASEYGCDLGVFKNIVQRSKAVINTKDSYENSAIDYLCAHNRAGCLKQLLDECASSGVEIDPLLLNKASKYLKPRLTAGAS